MSIRSEGKRQKAKGQRQKAKVNAEEVVSGYKFSVQESKQAAII
jgi:hypothetical protein